MAADTTKVPARSARNGSGKQRLLTRHALDGRTRARKQFDAIASGIARDLAPGGEAELSTVAKHLIEGFASIAVHVHDLNARLLLGEQIDIVEHSQAISTMVRIASRIGIGRVPRNVTPDLRDYLEERADEAAS